jgi:uncharacterized membrane-anchored protein YhcB (DUF1043 family)
MNITGKNGGTMTDQNSNSSNAQVTQNTAQNTPAAGPIGSQSSSQPARKKSGWFRRLFFIFLMLAVIAGVVISVVLLRMRLDVVLSEVDRLDAQLESVREELNQTQTGLNQTQTDLESTQQALEDLAQANIKSQEELEARLHYYILLVQAQEVSSKAILSITEDDLGQARREIITLRAALVAASGLASEEDIVILADLEQRAAQAESDLNNNSFATQQTLEVIWRALSELSTAVFSDS